MATLKNTSGSLVYFYTLTSRESTGYILCPHKERHPPKLEWLITTFGRLSEGTKASRKKQHKVLGSSN